MSNISLSEESLITFSRQLQTLIGSGVPLFRALEILIMQAKDVKLHKILESVIADLAEGKSLTNALKKHDRSFSPFFQSMTSIGESRGELDESLMRVYKYLESAREVRQKFIAAIIYPAMLIISGFFVLLAMILLVLPKFVDIFSQSGVELPGPTRVLVSINILFSNYGVQILWFLVTIVILFVVMRMNKKGTYRLHAWQLKLPIIGEFLLSMNVARFCRSLGVLYESGVQLLESIELSNAAMQNVVLKGEVNKIIKSVKDGGRLSEPLMNSAYFPQMMAQMVAVGEESGSLSKLLVDVADYYEQDLDYKVKRYLSMLEPVALLVIAIMVSYIAAAILLPLFKMAGSLSSF